MSSEDRFKLPPEVIEVQLEEYRLMFEAGYADALMLALLFCAKCRIAMPDWVDWELHQAWHRFVNRTADDLGEAFGIQWPKGKHKAAYQKKRRLEFDVYNRVRKSGRPIDDQLFEDVGRELNIGKRLASEYYYSAKKKLNSMPAAAGALLKPYMKKPEGGA